MAGMVARARARTFVRVAALFMNVLISHYCTASHRAGASLSSAHTFASRVVCIAGRTVLRATKNSTTRLSGSVRRRTTLVPYNENFIGITSRALLSRRSGFCRMMRCRCDIASFQGLRSRLGLLDHDWKYSRYISMECILKKYIFFLLILYVIIYYYCVVEKSIKYIFFVIFNEDLM